MVELVQDKFSLIIPAHKLFKRVIDNKYEVEACIDSILDQDYKNYEIILVANGPDRAEIAQFAMNKYGTKITLLMVEEANAAIARNTGARVATGEFRSYFSSDLTMYPGILRVWKNAFDKNPDAAIIYSRGIDWVEGGKSLEFRAYTDEYDQYRMTCHNLIDGANPVRAKDDQEWDADVKALQDWNWALKVLKPMTTEAKKALMIEEIFYTTEKPKAGGLSDYFSTHWEELNRQIKDRHGIPERNVAVSSLGAPFHGLRTAKIMDADFNIMPSMHPHNYDCIYLLGYYLSNIIQHNNVFKGAKRDTVRCVHWIGSDILQLMYQPWLNVQGLARAIGEYIDINFAECEATQQELAALGIKSEVLPLALDTNSYPFYTEVPETYTVAIYAPYWDSENIRKYNLTLMTDIARSMPDFKFVFFGSKTGYPELSDNCETLGWVDIKDIAKKANAILRFPFHDGLPVSVCEFLLMGREAFTSVPMLGTYYIGDGMLDANSGTTDYESAKSRIIKLLRDSRKNPSTAEFRQATLKYYQEFLSPERVKKVFTETWTKRQQEVREDLKKTFEERHNAEA